jgi:hypothetical protein
MAGGMKEENIVLPTEEEVCVASSTAATNPSTCIFGLIPQSEAHCLKTHDLGKHQESLRMESQVSKRL